MISVLTLFRRIPWQAYAIAVALLAAWFWHRAEVRESYRDGQANVWAQVEKAQAAQRQREIAATAKLEQARRLEALEASARQKELSDATANIPDQSLSARQRAILCVELQQQAKASGGAASSC